MMTRLNVALITAKITGLVGAAIIAATGAATISQADGGGSNPTPPTASTDGYPWEG